ncbi:MAG: hypothetical protein ACWA5K_05265 [bacterium]
MQIRKLVLTIALIFPSLSMAGEELVAFASDFYLKNESVSIGEGKCLYVSEYATGLEVIGHRDLSYTIKPIKSANSVVLNCKHPLVQRTEMDTSGYAVVEKNKTSVIVAD